jgi:hypothetical protein
MMETNKDASENADFSAYSPALGDWRLALTTWVTGIDGQMLDVPLQANQVTTHHASDIHLSFPTPSAAALHLNSSWRCARRAFVLREKFGAKVCSNTGAPLQMSFEGVASGPLFEFFEEMMGTVAGAMGAIEAFCNRCIIDTATGPISVKGRKGRELKSPEEVVRFCGLEEKIKRIVPDLMGVSSPAGAGNDTYGRFMVLKSLRDSVTHFKRHDEARLAGKLHEQTALTTLFFTDQFTIPEGAMELIRYLAPLEKTPRWVMNPMWVRPVSAAQLEA